MSHLDKASERMSPLDDTQFDQRRHNRSRLKFRLLAGVATIAILGSVGTLYEVRAQTSLIPHTVAADIINSGAPTMVALPSFTDLVQRVKPAVVSVRVKADTAPTLTSDDGAVDPFAGTPFERFFKGAPRPNESSSKGQHHYVQGQGSGFFISSDGYVVTNNHVVDKAVTVEVVTDDGKLLRARVIGTDAKTDLALLKIDGRSDFPYVKLSKDTPKIGEWVLAMGNPFGLGGTVTAGIVSAQGRDIGNGPYDDFIQIDAAVNRGNSGGPTFNLKGDVIGVNTAIYSPSGGSVGIAFDIPASTIEAIVPQLKTDGKVVRGWLGVQIQSVTKEIADGLGMKEPNGVLIAEPQQSGPADTAGLKPGDVITSVAGAEIMDTRDLARKVAKIQPGTEVPLTFMRAGKSKTVMLRIGQLQDRKIKPVVANQATDDQIGKLGVVLAPSGQVIGAGREGLAVLEVDPDGKGAELGIARGDVILSAGGKSLTSPADLIRFLDEAKSRGKGHALLLVRHDKSQRYVAVPVTVG